MVNILTDSTADLSEELVSRFNIHVLPLTVIIGDKDYRDGVDINTQDLFSLVNQLGVLPKTAAPSIVDFANHFNSLKEVIYVGISSKLSACFTNSLIASQEIGNPSIHLVDSLNLSTGVGMLAIKAAEFSSLGFSAEEVVEKIRGLITKVRTSFVIDKFDYLYMGGRCTAMQSVIGSLLKIHPVIEVKPDGTLGVKDKIRGSRNKALNAMFLDFQKNLPEIDMHRIFITHTLCFDDAAYLESQIRSICSPDEICITVAGSVVASHCGPNTIGILYMLK
jgi:DegV family protein with EDD domain